MTAMVGVGAAPACWAPAARAGPHKTTKVAATIAGVSVHRDHHAPAFDSCASAGVAMDDAKAEVEALMRDIRRIGSAEDDDFDVMDMEQIATMLSAVPPSH